MEKLETTLIKHTKYIYEYTNVLSDESLDRIRNTLIHECIEKNDPNMSRLKNTRDNDAYILAKLKSGNKKILDVDDELENLGYYYLKKYYSDCKLINSYYKPHGVVGSAMTYRVYSEKDQYNWHVDTDGRFNLLISFLLYLNDDYEGGHTKFLNDRLKVYPKKGSVLMFPCGPYFVHKSTPIKSGMKHIVWNCYTDCPQEFMRALKSMTDK